MTVVVSTFFAPKAPKRPPNFVVLKYFLLGLLISNAIESILIIPKILDILDQSAIQSKALKEMDIKRTELKELIAEKEKEAEDIERERDRELKVLMKEKGSKATSPSHHGAEEEEEEEEEEENHHTKSTKVHPSKNHKNVNGHGSKQVHDKKEEHHVGVRKRPQRLETGNNLIAVFMLFYGSATLCLGIPAIFQESVMLLRFLVYLSCLGTGILVTNEFSLIMLMSVVKDIIIAGLTFYYLQMITASNPPGDPAVASSMMAGQAANPSMAPTTVTADAVNPFPATNVPVDYTQPGVQVAPGW